MLIVLISFPTITIFKNVIMEFDWIRKKEKKGFLGKLPKIPSKFLLLNILKRKRDKKRIIYFLVHIFQYF